MRKSYKQKIIEHLEQNIKQSIFNDVRDIANFHAQREKNVATGFFSVPRQVFCYIDYLGGIAGSANGNTKNAEGFIKDCFPPIYKDYAELIYAMWRHGTVHEYAPKKFYAEYPSTIPKKIKIIWFSYNENEEETRQRHLSFFPVKDKYKAIYLVINNCQLVDDLLVALDNFILKLKGNSNLARECWSRVEDADQLKGLNTIQGQSRQRIVSNQILLAWGNRSSSRMDSEGNVTES